MADQCKCPDIQPIPPLTICEWIVGRPGPDVDICIVTGANPDGSYRVRYQVYGTGEFRNGTARGDDPRWGIWPLRAMDSYPWLPAVIAEVERLKAEGDAND